MNNKNYFLMAGLVILAIGAGLFLAWPACVFEKGKEVVIPYGATTAQISQILKEEKLIPHPTAFKILVKILGWEKNLKNGIYRIKPSFFPFEAARIIKEGRAVPVSVTIPEGLTLEQIAGRFQKKLGIPKEEFLKTARVKNFYTKFVYLPDKENLSLEGYLFPDTYSFSSFGATPELVINLMLKRFEEMVLPLWQNYEGKIKIKTRALNLFQIITLASVVEKEAILPEERILVAGVFWNRLKKSLGLESCATINYILKKPHLVLNYKDLKIRSPYNTYLHSGLPPGPIASPGLASIKAVLEPARTDYLYFVAADGGRHVFSKSFKEHVQNQQKYLRQNLEK